MKKLLSLLLSLPLMFVAGEKAGAADKPLTIAMMPKSKGNAYFISCRKGAEQAAKDLGVKLLWDGPTEPDPARQNEIVETWITRGVDVIAVSVENERASLRRFAKPRKRASRSSPGMRMPNPMRVIFLLIRRLRKESVTR